VLLFFRSPGRGAPSPCPAKGELRDGSFTSQSHQRFTSFQTRKEKKRECNEEIRNHQGRERRRDQHGGTFKLVGPDKRTPCRRRQLGDMDDVLDRGSENRRPRDRQSFIVTGGPGFSAGQGTSGSMSRGHRRRRPRCATTKARPRLQPMAGGWQELSNLSRSPRSRMVNGRLLALGEPYNPGMRMRILGIRWPRFGRGGSGGWRAD